MRLPENNWFAAVVLLACVAHLSPRNPLSNHVRHFSIGKTTALDALIWLGRDEQISFGIEFYGTDLSKTVEINIDNATVGDVVKKILGSIDSYQLSVLGGVILIRRKGETPPDWLNHRIRRFTVPRGELMLVNSELWMALETDLDPTIRGFSGDYPGTNPIDEVGPFDERGQTVRQLLVKIVSASRGATWYPTQNVQGPAPSTVNGFWTLVTYSGNWASRPK
jgi:hypothetical protein